MRVIAKNDEIEVREEGGIAYKIFVGGNFRKQEIFYEAMLHSTAEGLGLPTAKVYGVEYIEGKLAVISEYIEGKTYKELIEEKPEDSDYYLERMVELQLEVQRKTVPDIKKLKHKLKREIDSLEILDYIKKYELQTRLEGMPKHSKLCHGNFTPDNIVRTADGRDYILDWVAASRGNASADIAGSYLKLSLESTENAEKYMKIFCEKTGTEKRYVQEWIPIMAASLLAGGKCSEKAEKIALAWLDVVDYD